MTKSVLFHSMQKWPEKLPVAEDIKSEIDIQPRLIEKGFMQVLRHELELRS